ncbi:hypothetical protein ANCCAN_05240 [Ancylostoma caninum]|uniref:Uncharacterized protein n=1 Tax=Ancylostoma caninum TaxID=29170 RepID=A0A368GW61_ANCCA|nr:hypothetical protein ANCCAN_05240 [Ancylostoma caninum]
MGTGSTYSSYLSRPTLTGEPYLSGYRGIPETQGSSDGEPNYMGALTKPSARKHTFGSYGSVDSGKGQAWLTKSAGLQGQQLNAEYSSYGSPSSDYSNTYSSGYPEYNSGTYSSYSGQKNPYSANYQGSTDQNYGVVPQHSYGSSDYSGYGSQGSNGYSSGSSQWPSATYGQQQYSYTNPNDGWQSAQGQPSTWLQTGNDKNVNSAGYRNLQVEHMFPVEGSTDYSNQMQRGGYSNGGYGYGTNDGSADYQQGLSSYSNTGQKNYGTTGQSEYGSQPATYQSSNYATPTYSSVPGGTVGRQYGYGNGEYPSQYGGASNDGYTYSGTKYSSYGTSQDYDKFSAQSQYATSYVPSQTANYGTGNSANYGTGNYDQSGNYQSTSYNSYTPTDYTSYAGAHNTNNGYRSADNSYGLGYSSYAKPQVEFAMNFGYGSQKAARNVDITPKLTNNVSPALAVEDGYKARNA